MSFFSSPLTFFSCSLKPKGHFKLLVLLFYIGISFIFFGNVGMSTTKQLNGWVTSIQNESYKRRERTRRKTFTDEFTVFQDD